MDRLTNTIAGRVVAVLLHGNSVRELEQRIGEFKDLPLCYCAINHFKIMEEKILNKINKNLNLIYCSNNKELNLRQQEIEEFLDRNDNNMFMTTVNPMVERENFVNKYHNKIYFAEQAMYTGGVYPNSLTVLLYALIKTGVKRVILFGCDGLDIEDTNDEKAMINTYYNKDYLVTLKKEDRDFNLIDDTQKFNSMLGDFLKNNFKTEIFNQLDIVNCNLNSHIKVFKKIYYSQVTPWYENGYGSRIIPMNKTQYSLKELFDIVKHKIFKKEELHQKYDKILTPNTVESMIIKYG